ncbi:hypothetical protein H072_10203 [Dactylellina haptotyla CBS 200.50]|uniref:Clr5 domain-containing protein n=1 Tax=Dactylellina haptotyla (strain CBS 200.50) TaxID=1284197 RepID=S8BM38_DACHA|nr:hypothetical protein H072_10203 [Dactylellina haptotyla CBS 200.50]
MSNILFKPVYDGARVQKRSYRRMEAWDDHKEFVLDLWKNKVKHERILETLRTERNFHANANQLKRQLGLWGISKKNLNKKQRKWIIQVTEKRKLEGKATRFYFSDTGLDIPESQLAGVWKAGLEDISDDIPPSPGELLAETPPLEREEVAGPSRNDMEDTHETADDMDVETATGMIVSAEPGNEIPPPENMATDINIDVNTKINIPIVSNEADEEIIREAPESVSGVLEEDIETETSSRIPFQVADILLQRRNTQPMERSYHAEMGVESDIVNVGGRPIQELSVYEPYISYTPDVAVESTSDAYLEVCESLESLNLSGTDENKNDDKARLDPPEYTSQLSNWISIVKHNSRIFLVYLEQALRVTGKQFYECFAYLYLLQTQQGYGEALPYPVLLSIAKKRPIQSLVNPEKAILSTTEWNKILALHQTYYDELKSLTDRAIENGDDEDPFDFRSKAAHLPYLHRELGDSNYFTISSLGYFAIILYEAMSTESTPDQIFVLEMSYKANRAIGMELHEENFKNAHYLSTVRFQNRDFLGALHLQRLACSIESRLHGASSPAVIQMMPDIALSYWKLREKGGALTVLKMCLRLIRETSLQDLEDREDQYIFLSTIFEIGTLLSRMKCKPERDFVFRYAISLYRDYLPIGGTVIDDDFAALCSKMGQMHNFLGDHLESMELLKYASDYFILHYGELYPASISNTKYLCDAAKERGTTMQIFPTVEKLWRVSQTNPRQDEEQAWEIFMMYSNAVFKVNGLDEELRSLARYLTN